MPVRTLDPELSEKARLELNEDPRKLESGLQHLREWIAKQPHLRARTDDQWLATFLRGCKFSIERTKEKIDLFYSLRTTAPEFYNIKHTHPRFKEILNLGSALVLPKTVKSTDPRVILVRPGLYDPDKYSITEIMAVMSSLLRIMFVEDDTFVISGGINITDLDGTSMGHATQITPALMKKMSVASQDASPIRMKGTHYLNTPPGFEAFINFSKTFLNDKNKNRIHVHNKDFESLYKHVPKEVLPAEYGGNGGTVKEIIDYWQKKVEEYSGWLDEDEQFGTDESKRPGKPKTAEDMFGLDGSFRQLEFD